MSSASTKHRRRPDKQTEQIEQQNSRQDTHIRQHISRQNTSAGAQCLHREQAQCTALMAVERLRGEAAQCTAPSCAVHDLSLCMSTLKYPQHPRAEDKLTYWAAGSGARFVIHGALMRTAKGGVPL
eukprot:1158458-Pelagomonas_calceolata.AAC.7